MKSVTVARATTYPIPCIRPANGGWILFSPSCAADVAVSDGVSVSSRPLHAVFIVTRAMVRHPHARSAYAIRSGRSNLFSRVCVQSNAGARTRLASGGEDAGIHST